MKFENTEMSQEDKRLLLMALFLYLGYTKQEVEVNTDEEVTAFCDSLFSFTKIIEIS